MFFSGAPCIWNSLITSRASWSMDWQAVPLITTRSFSFNELNNSIKLALFRKLTSSDSLMLITLCSSSRTTSVL